MAKVFYISEVIKFAIEKEEQSIALYEKMAEKTTEHRQFFEKLVAEEKNHEAIYAQMLTTVPDEQTPGVMEDEEYAQYTTELIDAGRRIPPIMEGEVDSLRTVLSYALAREKESVIFYVGLKNLVPTKNKEQIEKIIKEEFKHVAMFIDLRKKLNLE